MAAKYHQVIAELLEDEYDVEEAALHYEKAAELYKQECNFSSANKCYENIAEFAASVGDYDKVKDNLISDKRLTSSSKLSW